MELLRRLLDRYQSRLNYVVVQNELRGGDFRIFQQSGLVARALACNANIISIRRLDDNTMIKIDAVSSSFWAATQGNDQVTGLGMLERMRLRGWMQSAYEAIASVNP